MAWLVAGTVGAAPVTSDTPAERRNWFDDPFFQIASGLPGCPVPLGPFYTEAERRTQMHSRLERSSRPAMLPGPNRMQQRPANHWKRECTNIRMTFAH